MKRLVTTDGSTNLVFDQMDPDEPSEKEFEAAVIQALSLTYPGYKCFNFRGTFELEQRRFQPDLALVANDLSHWFVIEVELLSHSLHGHVLPQVKAFQYGKPLEDCSRALSRSLGIPVDQMRTMVECLPRRVVVVANRPSADWALALRVAEVQMLAVHAFQSLSPQRAYMVEGLLMVSTIHLGFGCYSAVDNAVRFSTNRIRVPEGLVQIEDPSSGISDWVVSKASGSVWISKARGTPSPAFRDGVFVQLLQTDRGRFVFRHDILGSRADASV